MSLVTRKPVFSVFDQVRLKPVYSEVSYSHEIANIDTRDIILSRQRTTKVTLQIWRGGGVVWGLGFYLKKYFGS